MSEKRTDKTAPDDAASAREQRLAEALRANLKRRKAAKKAEKDPGSP
jgi:hypothetical protein